MTPAVYIRDGEQLRNALEIAARSDFIAIDTEFMRERTYFAKLCLVQAATDDICVLIDPLALADLAPLHQFLADTSRVKVLHAARQDLEVLSQHGGTIPGPIFDTQTAAGLLGLAAQSGYADVVLKRLGVALAKGHARADWTARPLSTEQIEYAADDVRYLVPLYKDLNAALNSMERLSWLQEDMQLLQNPALYRTEPPQAWQRLRGLEQLSAPQRGAAKSLAQWREEQAIARDRPRAWILPDDALRAMAEQLPQTPASLSKIPSLPNGTLDKRGAQLLEAVRIGVENSGSEAPALQAQRADKAQLARISALMALVRDAAVRLQISPELLATRRDIEQFVFTGRLGNPAQGWRKAVIGNVLMGQVGAN
jgi:ribonuclease D